MLRNHVGYAQKEVNLSGGDLAAPMFQTVGSADHSIKFGEVIPVLESGAKAVAGKVSLQYLKSSGGTDTTHNYTWMGTYWFNMNTFKDAKDETIPAGQGLWVLNNSGGSTKVFLRSSGEVNQKDVAFELNLSGGTGCANPYPTATTFGRVLPRLGDGKESQLAVAGKVSLQYLKSSGGTDTTHNYTWMGTYWFNMNTFKDAKDEIIPAGQGLWVLNNSGGSTRVWLHVAAPEL